MFCQKQFVIDRQINIYSGKTIEPCYRILLSCLSKIVLCKFYDKV